MTWLQLDQESISNSQTSERSSKLDEEVAPGVIFERRSVLHVSALTAAALLFGSPIAGFAKSSPESSSGINSFPEDDEITWEQFLKMCVPVTKQMYKKKSAAGQDAYLFALAAQAVLLDDVPVKDMKKWRDFDPKYELELAHRGFPFIVIHWRMEANAVLPAHCHPGTSVCTLGLEGEALVRHFEPTKADAPGYKVEQKPFLIQETKSQLITPKRVSTLSETRDNIHYFVAGANGARGIDITTHYDSDGSFSFLKFDPEKPVDARKRHYEAVWVGSDLQNNF